MKKALTFYVDFVLIFHKFIMLSDLKPSIELKLQHCIDAIPNSLIFVALMFIHSQLIFVVFIGKEHRKTSTEQAVFYVIAINDCSQPATR